MTELVGLARDDAARMGALIDNLLNSARVAERKLRPELVPVPLRSSALAVLASMPQVARRTFVGLGAQLRAEADANLVKQILTNLFQNVDRYAPDGEVEITFIETPSEVWVEISDDGLGIPDDARESIFAGRRSGVGLGIGLALSRDLARAMGGDLECIPPTRKGATFRLRLPAAPSDTDAVDTEGPSVVESRVLPPRARVVVDMTQALAERSLDRAIASMQALYPSLLEAEAGVLLTKNGDVFSPAGTFQSATTPISPDDPYLQQVTDHRRALWVEELDPQSVWNLLLISSSALFLPVLDDDALLGVLAIGWSVSRPPGEVSLEVAQALAQLAAFAIDRASLAADVVAERRMTAAMMEALPVAVSVFAGDPPRVVHQNLRERQMLGIQSNFDRPTDLVTSQVMFDVRFADGTPLTADNAPVITAIRSGRRIGPLTLRFRRADGTEVATRTRCAPYFDDQGRVQGAVVTSEEVDPFDP
jgi:K+-sensing histidine kinase KdpD